jgi:DNA ligase (NAD+)
MEKFDANTRMEILIEALNYHTKLYDAGTPAISDAQWDKMYFELVELEKEFPSLIHPNSPTQQIHYEVVNELQKVKHEYQSMLSLDKTKDIEKVKEFLGSKAWIAMLKLDGLTCRLTYEEGKLVRAETRGDGYEGEDITHNARVLPSIPQRIDYYDTLIVDGEVVCDLDTFEQFKDEYANARNFAAGSIRLLDSKECAKRGLTFVAWDLIIGRDTKDVFLNYCLDKLLNLGFTIVPFTTLEDDAEDAIKWLEIGNKQPNYPHYPIDGIVFKWNFINEYIDAGRTDHHFRGGLAYKFYDEEYETELLDIEYDVSKRGILTPVAVFKPIEIDGATVERANLSNISILTEKLGHPYVGQKIWVSKRNQIIPYIERAEKEDE